MTNKRWIGAAGITMALVCIPFGVAQPEPAHITVLAVKPASTQAEANRCFGILYPPVQSIESYDSTTRDYIPFASLRPGAPPGVTRDNFMRIKYGMTELEVTLILGLRSEPWLLIGSRAHSGPDLIWTGNGKAYLMFDKQQGLVYQCWKEDGFASPTKKGFDQIKIGMTVSEVELLLGTPLHGYTGSPNEVTTGRWQDIDG